MEQDLETDSGVYGKSYVIEIQLLMTWERKDNSISGAETTGYTYGRKLDYYLYLSENKFHVDLKAKYKEARL